MLRAIETIKAQGGQILCGGRRLERPGNFVEPTIITGITQDEPLTGLGSGDACPDASGVGSTTAMLRAERNGTGDGRVGWDNWGEPVRTGVGGAISRPLVIEG